MPMTSCAQIHKMTRVLWQKILSQKHIETNKSFKVLRQRETECTNIRSNIGKPLTPASREFKNSKQSYIYLFMCGFNVHVCFHIYVYMWHVCFHICNYMCLPHIPLIRNMKLLPLSPDRTHHLPSRKSRRYAKSSWRNCFSRPAASRVIFFGKIKKGFLDMI